MEFLGARDVRMVEKLIRSPEWKMPDEVPDFLPKAIWQIVMERYPADHPDKKRAGKYVYSPRARLSASRILMQMAAANAAALPKDPLEIQLNVTGDLRVAMDEVKGLSREERDALAAAAPIFERLERTGGEIPPEVSGRRMSPLAN